MTQPPNKDAMTVDDAMRVLGVKTKSGLARKLGVVRQAVTIWENNNALPMSRVYQIRLMAIDATMKAGAK